MVSTMYIENVKAAAAIVPTGIDLLGSLSSPRKKQKNCLKSEHVRRNTYYQLSVTRELNHSRGPGVSHRDYFAWRK
jgi:hypothetical protein